MAGAAIENAKIGLAKALDLSENMENHLILYDDSTEWYNSDLKNVLSNVRARGGTNFVVAFKQIMTIMQRIVARKPQQTYNFRIYVSSDGGHNGDTQTLASTNQEMLTYFKTLSAQGHIVQCKARGFGSNVSIDIMQKLIYNGDYNHAATAQDIVTIFENDPLMHMTMVNKQLLVDNRMQSATFTPVNNDYLTKRYLSTAVAEQATAADKNDTYYLELRLPGRPNQLRMADGTPIETITVEQVDEKHTDYIENKVFLATVAAQTIAHDFASLLSNLPAQFNLTAVVAQLNDYSTRISQLEADVAGLRVNRLMKKSYMQTMIDTRSQINDAIVKLNDMARQGGRANSNVQGAIMSMGHAIKSRSLAVRAAKLALAGTDSIAQADAAIQQYVNSLHPLPDADANAAAADTPNQYRCHYTYANPPELARDSDVICMNGFMERKETCIGNPSMLKFPFWNPVECALAYSVFYDQLAAGMETATTDEQKALIHGGFSLVKKTAANAVMNAGYREKINFVLPMFINDEHWGVAKHLLPRVLAWITTLDQNAASFDQIKLVPFTMLHWIACSGLDSEYKVEMFYQVARICAALIKDYNLKHIVEDFDKFIDASYAHRVPKAIISLSTFAIKMLFLPTDTHSDAMINDAFDKIYVEAHRRTLDHTTKAVDIVSSHFDWQAAVPNIDIALDHADAKAATIDFKVGDVNALPAAAQAFVAKENARMAQSFTWINKIHQTVLFYRSRLPTIFAYMDAHYGRAERLETLSFVDDPRANQHLSYCNLVFNMIYYDNSSCETAPYTDTVNADVAVIETVLNEKIHSEYTARCNNYNNSIQDRMAAKFRMADISATVAIMKTIRGVGHPMHHRIVAQLEIPGASFHLQKIIMAIHGMYNGEHLWIRRELSGGGWCPSWPARNGHIQRMFEACNASRRLEGKPPITTENKNIILNLQRLNQNWETYNTL